MVEKDYPILIPIDFSKNNTDYQIYKVFFLFPIVAIGLSILTHLDKIISSYIYILLALVLFLLITLSMFSIIFFIYIISEFLNIITKDKIFPVIEKKIQKIIFKKDLRKLLFKLELIVQYLYGIHVGLSIKYNKMLYANKLLEFPFFSDFKNFIAVTLLVIFGIIVLNVDPPFFVIEDILITGDRIKKLGTELLLINKPMKWFNEERIVKLTNLVEKYFYLIEIMLMTRFGLELDLENIGGNVLLILAKNNKTEVKKIFSKIEKINQSIIESNISSLITQLDKIIMEIRNKALSGASSNMERSPTIFPFKNKYMDNNDLKKYIIGSLFSIGIPLFIQWLIGFIKWITS